MLTNSSTASAVSDGGATTAVRSNRTGRSITVVGIVRPSGASRARNPISRQRAIADEERRTSQHPPHQGRRLLFLLHLTKLILTTTTQQKLRRSHRRRRPVHRTYNTATCKQHKHTNNYHEHHQTRWLSRYKSHNLQRNNKNT